MKITKFILFILFFSINMYANFINRVDPCSDFGPEDCEYFDYCEWTDEGCVEFGNNEGPPECLLDCAGITDIGANGNPDELCDWIISINGTECTEDCEEEIIVGLEDLTEACYNCLSDVSLDCADVFEDDEEEDIEDPCSDFSQDDCEWLDYCEWTDQGCIESGDWNDDGGWDENGCLADNGDWYCYGCELFINDCEYFECTENGWAGPFENPNCDDDWGCSDLGEEECMEVPDCEPNYDAAGQFEGCLESHDDDGPPECLLDCEGIEYVDPSEDADETCDWIISNFGPNNFFNECAEDCDGETMELINQLVEACFDCLSDTTLDCGDVFDDEGEDQCSNYSHDDCEWLDYCEWIWDPATNMGECVESGPGGDDGGTGGGDGCFENGEWYCYGCELFINDCEYYECTEDGWAGPFESDNCWDNCEDLSQDECIDNPDCTWIWEDDSPIIEDGYCIESDDNPPGDDLVILSLEHTIGLPGTSVSVPLILNNLETVGGLQFSIGGYNTPNFPGMSVEWFESTDDCFSASYNEVDEQLIGIIFSIEGCSYPPEEHNHIADIIFYVGETVPVGVEVPLWFNYTLASDTAGNEIPSHGEDSSITLGMQGDVNFDGEINILDIVTVVNFAIFIEEPNGSQFWASDINDDGEINILDIVQLINMILYD